MDLKKNPEYIQLLKIAEQKQKLASMARQDLEDFQEKTLLPEIIKQYEGKYFKCHNSYGGMNPKWDLYKHVKKVVSSTHCLQLSFEKTSDNQIVIKQKEEAWLSAIDLSQEITRDEYMEAFGLLNREINKTIYYK